MNICHLSSFSNRNNNDSNCYFRSAPQLSTVDSVSIGDNIDYQECGYTISLSSRKVLEKSVGENDDKISKRELRIASYNVENMFDDIDDPLKKDEICPPKSPQDMEKIAKALRKADGDIVALQEIENLEILNEFVDKYLTDLYPYRALIEGNDIRGIDVAVISKYPILSVQSHSKTRFPLPNGKKTFLRRDLLRVDIDVDGKSLSVYTTHLKAHSGGKMADDVRLGEAKEIRRIIENEMGSDRDKRYILTGDFNDTPQSEVGQTFLNDEGWHLCDALERVPASEKVTHPFTHRSIDYILYPEHMSTDFVGGGVQHLEMKDMGSDHLLVYGDFII